MRLSLPVMQCDDSCGECCGVVPCHQDEFDRVRQYAAQHGIQPVNQGKTCPWFQQGRCQVYPVRPFICQLFGHSMKLVCCKGYNQNIPRQEEWKLRERYERRGPLRRFLHEILPGWSRNQSLSPVNQ